MQTTPPSATSAKNLSHMIGLAFAILLIPILLGGLFVLVFQKFVSPPPQPPTAETLAALTNQLYSGSVTNSQLLLALRRDLRNEGYETDDVNLLIWARQAADPTILFSVAPPQTDKRWNWHISQDGLYAVAVSVQLDALERRTVGLYDLLGGTWRWTSLMLWPDTHEQPYVFNGRLIVRYSKNGRRFALEADTQGRIVSIDSLGEGYCAATQIPDPNPLFAGTPITVRNGVFFTADEQTGHLTGYASQPLPGLRDAGKSTGLTLFSGNGLLKFTVHKGLVTVSDSLTQTVLQEISAWRDTPGTAVTRAVASGDGARLTLFLTTTFDNTPPVTRDWSVDIDLYSGTKTPSFNPPKSAATPASADRRIVTSDGRLSLAVNERNLLSISSSIAPQRELATVPLASVGLTRPVEKLELLDGGRHLVLRQSDHLWLLDLSIASGYGDLLARLSGSTNRVPPSVKRQTAQAALLDPDALYFEDTDETDQPVSAESPENGLAPAYLALRAELFAANQSWGYAAHLLEQTREIQAFDHRAPRVNPLLLTRLQLLTGRTQKAKLTCRDALRLLIADPTEYNRMIRYHLQGLYFANP